MFRFSSKMLPNCYTLFLRDMKGLYPGMAPSARSKTIGKLYSSISPAKKKDLVARAAKLRPNKNEMTKRRVRELPPYVPIRDRVYREVNGDNDDQPGEQEGLGCPRRQAAAKLETARTKRK